MREILKNEITAKLVVHALPIAVHNISYGRLVIAAIVYLFLHSVDILRTLLPDDVEIPTSFEVIGALLNRHESLIVRPYCAPQSATRTAAVSAPYWSSNPEEDSGAANSYQQD